MGRVRCWDWDSIPLDIALTPDLNNWRDSIDKLYKLTPNIKAIVADEMRSYMIQNNAAIGVTFSGKLARCWKKNPNLKYVVPTERPATFGLTI